MSGFADRLKEVFVGATGTEGLQFLIANLQLALRQQFPLCHIDTDAIDERLLAVAEEISAMRRRTKDAVPELPRLNPEPESIVAESDAEAPAAELTTDPAAEAASEPIATAE